MTNQKIEINAKEGTNEITIREGNALPLEPIKISINGIIDTPLKWLEKRSSEIELLKSHIQVDRDSMSIKLIIDEDNPYFTTIAGTLSISKDFLKFNVNNSTYLTPVEMAEFFKMNRFFFENRDTAMNLVATLKNFRAKVNKEVEVEVNQNKGDKRLLVNQVCEHNAPSSFVLLLPLFKGTKAIRIEVETYFRADDLTCCLISPQANELIEEYKNSAIDEVLKTISSSYPEIVIIEV